MAPTAVGHRLAWAIHSTSDISREARTEGRTYSGILIREVREGTLPPGRVRGRYPPILTDAPSCSTQKGPLLSFDEKPSRQVGVPMLSTEGPSAVPAVGAPSRCIQPLGYGARFCRTSSHRGSTASPTACAISLPAFRDGLGVITACVRVRAAQLS